MGIAAAEPEPCGTPQKIVHRYLQRFIAVFFLTSRCLWNFMTRVGSFLSIQASKAYWLCLHPQQWKQNLCASWPWIIFAYKQLLLTFFFSKGLIVLLIASNLLHVTFSFPIFGQTKKDSELLWTCSGNVQIHDGICSWRVFSNTPRAPKASLRAFFITIIWLWFKTLVKNLVQSTHSQKGLEIQSLDSKYTYKRNYG